MGRALKFNHLIFFFINFFCRGLSSSSLITWLPSTRSKETERKRERARGGGRGSERIREKKTELKTTKLKQAYRTTMFTANGYSRSIRCLKTPPKACTSPTRSYLYLSFSLSRARSLSSSLLSLPLLFLSLSLSICVTSSFPTRHRHNSSIRSPCLCV